MKHRSHERGATFPKAIILDLDDTILDSGDPDTSWRQICSEFADGLDGVTRNQLFAALIEARDWFWDNDRQAREGRLDLLEARRTIFARALSRAGVRQPEGSMVDAMARRYTNLRDEAVSLFPMALTSLGELREQGVKLGLLTNGSTDKQWAKIRQFDLAGFFDHIQVEGDAGFGKPDLRAFRCALAALDVAPEEAWMVGDNLVWDIQGAQRAGIYAIWIDPHGSGLDAENGVTPDEVVASLAELLQLERL